MFKSKIYKGLEFLITWVNASHREYENVVNLENLNEYISPVPYTFLNSIAVYL